MHWNDPAIVLGSKKYGESAAVVCLLTQSHGLYKGLVRSMNGKAARGIFQTGNFIDAKWSGRLPEHLGNFSAELTKPNAALLLSDSVKLTALGAICSLLEMTLPERDQCPDIYDRLYNFIEIMCQSDSWQYEYVILELELLTHLGFGLDLSECAATGATEDLVYLSPKSGRAVSRKAGEPYKSKLFLLPEYFITGEINEKTEGNALNGLDICAYFLEKYVLKPHNAALPLTRLRLREMVISC